MTSRSYFGEMNSALGPLCLWQCLFIAIIENAVLCHSVTLSSRHGSQSQQLNSMSESVSSRPTRQLIRHLAITMSNVTVIRRSEQTEVTGKLVIENILEEMKEAGPSNGPGIGSFVTSAVFRAGDFLFQLKMYLNNTEEDIQCIGAFIINMSHNAATLTNVCI